MTRIVCQVCHVHSAHMANLANYPGMEFLRTEGHIFFGKRNSDDECMIRVFCGCPRRQSAKSVLCCYKGKQPDEQYSGWCSTEGCNTDVKQMNYYWHCPNCFEYMCTNCHGDVMYRPKERRKTLQARLDAWAAHWVFEGLGEWKSQKEVENAPNFTR